ncbi:hypothetical protein BY458DRAFT_470045 [Sporodiniella umbellata]|nr:hypothetical protein BY458DRAFT_470045 [Sporodiniella umbellata]
MSAHFTIRSLSRSIEQFPMHHLFSPTALDKDLHYIDKTYYEEDNKALSMTELKSDLTHDLLSRSTRSFADLHNVGLLSVPSQLSFFTQLTVLDLSRNKLREMPACIEQLTNLRHLDVSYNQFVQLPTILCRLVQLVHLDISHNPLQHITANVSRLQKLSLLDLSYTDIQFIPAELLDLAMTTIRTEHCERLLNENQPTRDDAWTIPSLFELCAREMMQPILQELIGKKKKSRKLKEAIGLIQKRCPPHIREYLSSPRGCSSCGGPYFETCLVRHRLVQKQDESWIPVEYKLCSAHWGDENQRLLDMFSFKPRLALPKTKQPCLLELI